MAIANVEHIELIACVSIAIKEEYFSNAGTAVGIQLLKSNSITITKLSRHNCAVSISVNQKQK